MKNIKIILCDLDGTLLKDDKTISKRTIQTIQKARDKGILFGIATGRSLFAVRRLIKKWGIEEQCDVLLGFNGAQIYDEPLGIDEINHPLEGKYHLDIISHFEGVDCNISVYDENKLYAMKLDDLSKSLAEGNGFEEHLIENPEEFFKRDFPKLVIMTHDMEAVIERANSFSNPNYHSFKTAPVLYEYVRPEVSKTAGIKRLCELNNITMEQVCVFGDAQNDHDMIVNCGLGVCMANGSDATKALSDDITDLSNNEDGVADYIENHFL